MVKFLLTGVVAAALFPVAAHAAYGAIAFSSETGATGYSYSAQTRRAAENAAMANCQKYGGGCFIAIWFRSSCGALAIGSDWGWGTAWATSREAAGRAALASCRKNDDGCEIVQRVCSG